VIPAEAVIAALGLAPHPEGGHYRETWRAPGPPGARAAGTAIYFLLRAGEISRWHRIDAAEVWHFYAGAPLALSWSADGAATRRATLGNDLAAGHRPQIAIEAGAWQSAVSLGDWSLVGCTVAPGFDFAGFELAPPGWRPGGGDR
jgi:hypothetical protein